MTPLPGLRGTLVSSAFAERLPLDPAFAGERDARRVASLRRWWRGVRERCGPATSVRLLLDIGALPLGALLGYDVTPGAVLRDDSWLATWRSGSGTVPVLVTRWGAPLDQAWRGLVRHGLFQGTRWCIALNGTSLRVVDAGRTYARRHLEFDLEATLDHDGSAWLLALLLLPGRLVAPQPSRPSRSLAEIVAASDAHGQQVCASLRDGVRSAVEQLMAALLDRERGRRQGLQPAFEQSLIAVYRVLFLCFAEARQLVPTWHPVYRDAYTVDSLRVHAERDEPGLWEGFQAISRLAHQGCDAGDLRVTAFNGRLFAPGRAPLLERSRVDERRVREALLSLSTTASPDGCARDRIAYADLGVEQLGAVYEGLLEYAPAVEPAPPATRSRAVATRRIVLERTAGAARKASGTFYTPRTLTTFLVRQTLAPLVTGATAEHILQLRIVDPAMGSGAFLVAACRYLAESYETALVERGTCQPCDIADADRAGFRRLVAQRCLYGVDLNPMAVHLARLSLWLTTLAADRPLTFLDHRLAVGNSLVGTSPADVARRTPGPGRTRGSDERQLSLFDPAELRRVLIDLVPGRDLLATAPESTADDVRRKEAAHARLDSGERLRAWRTVCDLWCAAWFTDPPPSRALFESLVEHTLHGGGALPPTVAARQLQASRDAAAAARFFHWPLEFPEVFADAAGNERPDGGFDAVLGNPPWEMLRADAAENAEGQAVRARSWRFTRTSGLYHAQSSGHANCYQAFVERAIHLARPGGRVGLIVPSGLAMDQGSAPLRRLLFDRCGLETLVGFDNRAGVFPIHRSVRFLLLTGTRGLQASRVRCRLGLQDPATLDELEEQAESRRETAWPIAITRSLVERLSGPDLAIPDLRMPLDLRIAEACAERHPRVTGPGGWAARFARELNATDDRPAFSASPGLPVIEGKHVTPFAVDLDGVTSWIPQEAAARLLPPAVTFERPRLAFREVASATNRTTLIAAIVPAGAVTTHTLFCLRSSLPPEEQRVLCALLNSYVANFLVRLRVTTHVTLAILATLPVPRPEHGSPVHGVLSDAAVTLMRDPRDALAQADAQAAAAHAYGVSEEEFSHVLASFPLVEASARRAALDAFTRGRPRPRSRRGGAAR